MSNSIVQENAILEGRTPRSYWDVEHSRKIEGFATQISVDAGQRVDFKINVSDQAGSDYKVEIFRLGYYGGDGARKVAEWTNTDAKVQPDAQYDATRGLVDAGNWSVTDTWQTPADAVSGVYLARVQRLDANGDPIDGAANQIPFILREDDRASDIVLQTSDTTWHAYNGWFGNNGQVGANFYGDASGTIDHPDIPGAGFFAQDRAYAVSYNRPFITRGIDGDQGGPAAGAQDYLFGADYAAISWLEQNGYDVAYMSGVDTERLGTGYLQKYDAFISVGHDEYWSADQRYNVEAARDAGVNLLFWGGNDIYWKTRWETSIVDGVEYRTLVCYKETWAHADPGAGPQDYYNLDPTNIWTGTWRDDRFIGNPLAGDASDRPPLSGQPHLCNCAENSLSGQLFGPDWGGQFGGAIDVPEEYAPLRVWRDTTVANGGKLDIAPGILGYEWNTAPADEYRPSGLIELSETTIDWNRILIDKGNTVAPGTATHNLTLYRAPSGALVFGAGTVFWSWALSDEHDNEPYGADIENRDLQQFVVNLFADMGIQPGVADTVLATQGLLRASASSDTTAARVTLENLPDQVSSLSAVTIRGTATDDDGNPATADGRVALVEVSLDGGNTWKVAEGRSNWSYTWRPVEQTTYTILARAIDDSLNLPAKAGLPSETVQVTEPVPPETVSLFEPFTAFNGISQTDAPVELGTRFEAAVTGTVTELKYYRHASDAGDTDTRTGHLWDVDGTLLATATFTSAPGATGWQTAVLDVPIGLLAGEIYTVSYKTANNYVASSGFFQSDYVEPYGVLAAPAGQNGVFAYGNQAVFPTQSFGNSNYWVDVTFAPGSLNNASPVFTSPSTVAVDENQTAILQLAATDPDGDSFVFSISGGADRNAFLLDARTGALTFTLPPDHEFPEDSNGDNVYEVTVRAVDRLSPPAEQTIAVTVNDIVSEGAITPSSLFGLRDRPQTTITTDPTDYELGVRFRPSEAGTISGLRYFRGAEDASDTDTRSLHLWSASGTLLATATLQSNPGQSGWQTATLDTPVAVQPGVTYVASYGTVQNYVASSNYFSTDHTGRDGVLTAFAAGGNGVYATAGPGAFPTQVYNATNYWVDVVFTPGALVNSAPTITSPADRVVSENVYAVGSVVASDPEGTNLTYSIAGGADAARFLIDAGTGALTFVTPADYETPADADGNGVYDLLVSAFDGFESTQQAMTIAVSDVASEPFGASTLFGLADAPALAETSDPGDYELGVRFRPAQSGAIDSLLYWRAPQDAGDTDTRTLTLWSASGEKLSSATVTSAPGESGWQVAALAAPVSVAAGQTYVASYGTTQNYAYTPGFFGIDRPGYDGLLSVAAGNGSVLSDGGTGGFPTRNFGDTNYWVDVGFQPGDFSNQPPVFTSGASFSSVENGFAVATLAATDPDNSALSFALAGGSDAARFTLGASSGELSFIVAPNYEAPADANGDNVYELTVSVTDGVNPAVEQAITVSVQDDPAETATPSSLFGQPPTIPGRTMTGDTMGYELGVKFTPSESGQITTLMYYRGAEDAQDTDIRTLNLWSSNGQSLGSASVTSTPGQQGWQAAILDTPIQVADGSTYVASYGTQDNYVYSSAFFNNAHVGTDGILVAPGGANGTFAAGSPGAFPDSSFNSTNYWVDVLFESDPAQASSFDDPFAM